MEKALTAKRPPLQANPMLKKQDAVWFLFAIFGFFTGRVIVLNILNPIAIPYIANFLGTGLIYPMSLLTAVGFFTKLKGIYLIKYLVSLFILCGTNLYMTKKHIKPTMSINAAAGGAATLITGAVVCVFNGFSLYFAIMALLEGLLTFSVTFLLKKGADVMYLRRKKKLLKTEDLISIAIILGGVIAGASDIYIGLISLRLFFVTVVVLLAGYKGGSALGATVGMLLGLTLYFLGLSDVGVAAIFSVCGIGAGINAEKGKLYSVLGFTFIGAVTAFFVDRSFFVFETLFSMLSGIALFFFLPDNFYFNINSVISSEAIDTETNIERMKDIVDYRLNGFSETFKKLARSLNGMSEKRTLLSQKDVARIIDDLADTACGSCSMKCFCWENNFYETYQAVFCLLGAYEKKGSINISDMPDQFINNCVSAPRFLESAVKLFEVYKINLTWHNKISESRSLISNQLMSVSNIIKNLADELDIAVNFNQSLEDSITAELLKNNIEDVVEGVIVLESKDGKHEVTITHKACYMKKSCTKQIIPIVSKVLGKKMVRADNDCIYKKEACRLRLVEAQKFRVLSGVSHTTKNGSKETGDSYTFMELKNGQCLIALSDGMGSGKKAREGSQSAVELLESFVECGFDKETAVKMINSVLFLKNGEDTFSTLDICSIDLYSGEAEFVKIGAASTFLLRDGAVQTIRSSSLPVGILNDVAPEVTAKQLRDNDTIIMVTDGVTEVIGSGTSKGEWLAETLCEVKTANPQNISDCILKEAERLSNDFVKDDMTVLVAKITRR